MIKNEDNLINILCPKSHDLHNTERLASLVYYTGFELAGGECLDSQRLIDDYGVNLHHTSTIRKLSSGGKKINCWRGFILENIYTGQAWRFAVTWAEQYIYDETQINNVKYGAPTKVKGKNIGRANETNPVDQARLEITSLMNKKRDEGYGEKLQEFWLPMLAQTYTPDKSSVLKHFNDLPFVWIQPKIDGVRCTWKSLDGNRNPLSRRGKVHKGVYASTELRWNLLDLEDAVCEVSDEHNFTLDIELVLPSEHSFEDTVSAVKKYSPKLTDNLRIVLLDIHFHNQPNWDYAERYLDLVETVHDTLCINGHLRRDWFYHLGQQTFGVVPHTFKERMLQFAEQGYEGAMIRIPDVPYEPDKRSYGLWKYKPFHDAEFKVVGLRASDQGATEGCAILVCETSDGKSFEATPKLSHAERRAMWTDRNGHSSPVGTMWTIRYQNLTEDGIPRFPVGVSPRNYEWD